MSKEKKKQAGDGINICSGYKVSKQNAYIKLDCNCNVNSYNARGAI